MTKTTLQHRLAVVAFGVLLLTLAAALLAPDGKDGVNSSPRFLSVVALAEEIRERKQFQLIDLRPAELFEEFHLPTAVNMPAEHFNAALLPADQELVFYSGDDALARQIWESLPDSVRRRSRVLYGGVRDWFDRLLYPNLPLHPSGPDAALSETIEDLSQFYSGQAEFVDDANALDYYKIDLKEARWPARKREGKLQRRGC